jgi:hypothetical protein
MSSPTERWRQQQLTERLLNPQGAPKFFSAPVLCRDASSIAFIRTYVTISVMVTRKSPMRSTRKKSSSSSKLRLLKIPASVYLEPEQAKELKALSVRTRTPQQVYLREGVQFVLAKHRSK